MSRPHPRDPGGAGTLLEWAMAGRMAPGETASGDACLVQEFPGGALVGVVDGLGHGEEAAAAARAAIAIIREQPEAPVLWLMRRCHEGLLETRGVVMSLASINSQYGTMTWIGIGNVEGILVRADPSVAPATESLLLKGGVVGYQLPHLWASVITVTPGDTLVMATDGVRSDFGAGAQRGEAPQHLADRVLSQYGKGHDDALVVAARFCGATA